ncbi:MAG: hypothetical protein JWR19_1096 [Pedosphaera sp.]|nr:hypothetical protein [Pedosphaera sp.]
MNKTPIIFTLLLSACLTLYAQGNRKQSAELWVDAHASGGGDGSAGKPFNTIQQAALVAVAGDTIHVLPGIYRERVMPERGGEPGRPIIYQSELLHGAVVKGSDVWSPPWRNDGGGIFSGELSDAFFTDNGYVDCGNPYRIAYYWDQKRQRPPYPFAKVVWTLGQVFADGRPLKETSSKNELAATSQAWWFDPAENRIDVNLGGKSPQDQQIEITTRRGVFRPQKKGLGYIEVRGFVFEHCANQLPGNFWGHPANAQSGMVGTRGGHHWVIADNIIRYAKGIGLTFGTSGGMGIFDNESPAQADPAGGVVGFDRITGNIFEFNGAIGAMGYDTRGVEVSSNLFVGNNVLLNTSYETGGLKTHMAYDLRVEGNWFVDNDCEGVWLDNTWKNCRVTRNIFLGNRGKNLFFEMDDNDSSTAARVWDNIFLPGRPLLKPASTQPYQPWEAWSVGIYGHDASGVHIDHNLFAGEGYGLYFRKMDERKGGAAKLDVSDNIFAGEKLIALCLPISNPPIVESNLVDGNSYPASRCPFVATGWSISKARVDQSSVEKIEELTGADGGEPARFGDPKHPPFGYYLSFDQWRRVMDFDWHSSTPQIGCDFDRTRWELDLMLPENIRLAQSGNEEKTETDFFGRPFLNGYSVGPFAGCAPGTNSIQLPVPHFDGMFVKSPSNENGAVQNRQSALLFIKQ